MSEYRGIIQNSVIGATGAAGGIFVTPEEWVRIAASNLVTELLERVREIGEAGDPRTNVSSQVELESVLAQLQIAQTAMSLPLASVGSCHCGSSLRYKGKSEGLYVCCTGLPEHCWKIG